MAIPDYRHVFDVHKYPTRLDEFLKWYHTDRTYNDAFDIFHYYHQHLSDHLPQAKVNPNKIRAIKEVHGDLLERLKTGTHEYVDVHVSYFTPTSLFLILSELDELEYTNLQVQEMISGTFEIIIHLRKSSTRSSLTEKQRSDYHFKIIQEMSEAIRFKS